MCVCVCVCVFVHRTSCKVSSVCWCVNASVCVPGDIRNDLYLTLERGDFERGGKSVQKNIEVTVYVLYADGEILKVWKCCCCTHLSVSPCSTPVSLCVALCSCLLSSGHVLKYLNTSGFAVVSVTSSGNEKHLRLYSEQLMNRFHSCTVHHVASTDTHCHQQHASAATWTTTHPQIHKHKK